MKPTEELIFESAMGLVTAARKNPDQISLYHAQLLGMRTVVFFVFGEGDLYRDMNELLVEMNTPVDRG
jgi:hypothetical protein